MHKFGDKTRVTNILQTVAQTCVSSGFNVYNQRICGIVGNLYFEKSLFSKAYTFYLRANDIGLAIKALKNVMKAGYKGEQDLFVARLCFEVLIRNYKEVA